MQQTPKTYAGSRNEAKCACFSFVFVHVLGKWIWYKIGSLWHKIRLQFCIVFPMLSFKYALPKIIQKGIPKRILFGIEISMFPHVGSLVAVHSLLLPFWYPFGVRCYPWVPSYFITNVSYLYPSWPTFPPSDPLTRNPFASLCTLIQNQHADLKAGRRNSRSVSSYHPCGRPKRRFWLIG